MIETLTVRSPSILLALERGEEELRQVRWLYEQGSDYDWDLFYAMRHVAFVTDRARMQARYWGVREPSKVRLAMLGESKSSA